MQYVSTRLVVILPTMYLYFSVYFSFEVYVVLYSNVGITYACIMSNFLQSGDDLIDQAIPLILTVGET